MVALASWAAVRIEPLRAAPAQRLLLLAIPLAMLAAPRPAAMPALPPAAQVYAPSDREKAPLALSVSAAAPADVPARWLLPPAAALVALSAIPAALALAGLARTLRGARRIRRIRGVELWLAPAARTPFAVWLGRPIVVLDPDTAMDPGLAALAVRHELQHHRHHDPQVAWFIWALGLVAPAALLLRRPFTEAEELAVDAALVRRGEPRAAYAAALFSLSTRAAPPLPLGSGMAAFLPRRLTMLLKPPAPSRAAPFVLLAFVLLAAPAGWAGSDLLADHRVATRDFREATLPLLQDFPTAAHPGVARALDQLVATEGGCRWADRSLTSDAGARAYVEAQLRAAGLPLALAAVPFVESGYRNREESSLPATVPPGQRGAGYWMFIGSTARAYGLEVSPARDERLDLGRETTAAIALLRQNRERYGDWALSLAAYNQGERAVDIAIAAGGTRDALALADAGHLNDYVAQVLAAAMLLDDPSLLR